MIVIKTVKACSNVVKRTRGADISYAQLRILASFVNEASLSTLINNLNGNII